MTLRKLSTAASHPNLTPRQAKIRRDHENVRRDPDAYMEGLLARLRRWRVKGTRSESAGALAAGVGGKDIASVGALVGGVEGLCISSSTGALVDGVEGMSLGPGSADASASGGATVGPEEGEARSADFGSVRADEYCPMDIDERVEGDDGAHQAVGEDGAGRIEM
ncbi:uncharacterized protein BO97DRAFT_446570 [Aspergillus homomorphus CBS 101889]|uniref:Uncharacterized protein n=1 Tax=Aspergillus homomorphus (strain CBS 101889) TaxID=1450537 RepID=A0A395HIP8_ASPHC|nr:hypothetical protein BO97DRAFT_446570 [Aspergillus homomorphus CBS 101889]RAL07801.1 hypothetical protein BO97DRAFT_446570 [Aspergillus homomorphus CBS 101889]